MNNRMKTIVFALILCLACSFLLTFAATSLKPFQEENVRIDKQKNILKVLNLIDEKTVYTKKDLSKLYETKVKNAWVSNDGQLLESKTEKALPIYLALDENKQIDAYAIPISGYGLWSYLYGYFSLKSDGNTVVGITFYQHGETPGLGGEVEKPWFQNNFVGKHITDRKGNFVSIKIAKGKAKDVATESELNHYVDGISGATITSKGVETFLKKDLTQYEPFSKILRKGRSFR